MADSDSDSLPPSDADLAAIHRKLNWLSAAVVLLFVIEIARFIGGAVSITGDGPTLIVLLGGGLVAVASLLATITSNYE